MIRNLRYTDVTSNSVVHTEIKMPVMLRDICENSVRPREIDILGRAEISPEEKRGRKRHFLSTIKLARASRVREEGRIR